MNAKSKAKLHAIAEKWLGKECVLLHVRENYTPEKGADYAEIIQDCANIGKTVAVYRPGYGLRLCNVFAGRVFALVPIQHPRAAQFAPWWKETKIRLAI